LDTKLALAEETPYLLSKQDLNGILTTYACVAAWQMAASIRTLPIHQSLVSGALLYLFGKGVRCM
jgi:hypothetical protein